MITMRLYVQIASTTQKTMKTIIATMKTATVMDYRLCMMTVAKILKKKNESEDK